MEPKILVGIPAYNEERAIAIVVSGALPYADAVVVVDDGSSDRTSAEALRAGATVIRHHENSGKGVAIVTLFQHAMAEQADVLVLIDGDGQHDPAEIPAVVEPCLTGDVDLVVGSRFLPSSGGYTPRIRRLGQLAFNSMTAVASGVSCSDSQSGFRAFSRRAFCAMRISEASFSVESEMQFECRVHGLRLAEVPISCSYDMPPKRNVLAHGALVLSRLSSMAVQRRVLGQQPLLATEKTPHTIVGGELASEARRFESFGMAPGD